MSVVYSSFRLLQSVRVDYNTGNWGGVGEDRDNRTIGKARAFGGVDELRWEEDSFPFLFIRELDRPCGFFQRQGLGVVV